MKKVILCIIGILCALTMNAERYNYNFNSVRLSEALNRLVEEHPNLNLNFIYNELDSYTTSTKIDSDNPYEALRKIVGLNPVSVIKKGDWYYVEALQHGKYEYHGRLIGSDGLPVVAATILLLTRNDSTVITYGFSDDEGRFSIPCDRQRVIAKLSCIGFKPLYKDFDSFNVGVIRMTPLPIKLRTVTVESDNSTLLTDKSIYRPTQRQKKASQSAVDLLRNLAIPQITVNLVDESVTTLTGASVAIYVNGLPASSEELTGMRMSDVKTVEYLDFPTDPRFNGCEHVINFIMQKYEYGGYTKLSVNENALVGLSSRASVYSKFTYKSMVFDLYAGASNQDLRHSGTSRIGEYTLEEKDGSDYNIIRKETNTATHFKYNQYPITLRAVYDSDKIQIGNTMGFNFDQNPRADSEGHLSYSTSSLTGYSYQNKQPYTTRHFIWSGAYYFILPNDFQLSLSPRTNYGHTNYSYLYSTSLPEGEAIENSSREDYYRMSGGIALYKSFSQKHGATVNIYAGTNKNEVKYLGSAPYENDFSDSFAGVRIGYNFTNHKWRVNSNIALQWERNGINGEYISEFYPLINISSTYSPSGHHSLQAFFHYGANYPDESVKSPNVLQDNELMYKTGNPNLTLSRQITFNLQYNWVANNRFSMSFYSQYFGEYGLYVPIFEHYRDGSAILKSYCSDQDYNRTQLGLSFNLKLFDGSLQLAAQPSVTLFHYTGYYDMAKTPFLVNASATYYLKHFFIQCAYQSANKTIQGNMGVWYKSRDFYQLQAGWGNSDWNIRLSVFNLFRGDWLAGTQTLHSPLYSETLLQDGTYYHRRLNLSVTYTFGYGKKVQRSNEVGEQSGGSSAILK